MTFDMEKILESKRAYRQTLAAKPIAEKLRLLDELRERELTLRRSRSPAKSNIVRERPAKYKPR